MQNNILENQLSNYFSIFKAKIDFVNQVKKEYSKTLASDFNSLDFTYFGENKVSEILCFLLNPNEKHGQGDTFLKLFIEKFNLNFSYKDKSDINAVVEKRTHNNRRIDIFISNSSNGNVIAIENKIYNNTKDQYNQLNDYLNYLQSISLKNNFTFFYLAPQDKVISAESLDFEKTKKFIENGNFKKISYEKDIISLVHNFANSSENERVRSFILDYERKLKTLYMGNSDINETEVVKKTIIENKDNLELSFKIFNNIKNVKADLLNELTNQMIEIGHELNIEFDSKQDRFILPKLGDNKIGVSFEGGGVFWGIVRKTDDKIHRKYQQIENLFLSNYNNSYWWSLYIWQFQNIEVQPDFWISIINKSFKANLKSFIQTLQDNNFEMVNSYGE